MEDVDQDIDPMRARSISRPRPGQLVSRAAKRLRMLRAQPVRGEVSCPPRALPNVAADLADSASLDGCRVNIDDGSRLDTRSSVGQVLGLAHSVRGALFDLDGVLTQTAKVHAAAWKEMFDDYLRRHAEQTNTAFVAFDPVGDYDPYADGKPRADGPRPFLESR